MQGSYTNSKSFMGTSKNPCFVIPAQAGIQQKQQNRFPLSRE
jgi:hypothetical protein